MYTAVGYSDEKIHFYRASDLKAGYQNLDDGEFLKPFWMDSEELYQQVMNGEVEDSKTMVAAFLLHQQNMNA